MRRHVNAHYEAEFVALDEQEHDVVHLGVMDEVVSAEYRKPYTYLTVLRYIGNDPEDDPRIRERMGGTTDA